MSKKKLSAFQQRTLESILKGVEIAEAGGRDDGHFYYPCPNDYCCGRNGSRYEASAWKLASNKYLFYCPACGQDLKMEKAEFIEYKKQIEFEKKVKKIKTEEKKKEVVKTSNADYYIEEYLDCAGE